MGSWETSGLPETGASTGCKPYIQENLGAVNVFLRASRDLIIALVATIMTQVTVVRVDDGIDDEFDCIFGD